MKAHELIADDENWTTGNYAVDIEDNRCSPMDDAARRWCAQGAIEKCYDRPHVTAMCIKLRSAIPKRFNGINDWNDSSGHVEVIRVLKELGI